MGLFKEKKKEPEKPLFMLNPPPKMWRVNYVVRYLDAKNEASEYTCYFDVGSYHEALDITDQLSKNDSFELHDDMLVNRKFEAELPCDWYRFFKDVWIVSYGGA
jgi:hypothetical protein